MSGVSDWTLRVWDVATGRQVEKSLDVGYYRYVSLDRLDTLELINCFCVSLSPDCKTIVWGNIYGNVYMWNIAAGEEVGDRHSWRVWGMVQSVAYSPDGSRIVSGINKTIRFWDATTCNPIGDPIEGHTGAVTAIAYSPDGKYVISGSTDSTIRIWDIATGKQVGRPWKGHASTVDYVSFSPDGKHVLSKSEDGTVRIWDFPSLQELINETRKRFKDCELTPEERKSFYLE